MAPRWKGATLSVEGWAPHHSRRGQSLAAILAQHRGSRRRRCRCCRCRWHRQRAGIPHPPRRPASSCSGRPSQHQRPLPRPCRLHANLRAPRPRPVPVVAASLSDPRRHPAPSSPLLGCDDQCPRAHAGTFQHKLFSGEFSRMTRQKLTSRALRPKFFHIGQEEEAKSGVGPSRRVTKRRDTSAPTSPGCPGTGSRNELDAGRRGMDRG